MKLSPIQRNKLSLLFPEIASSMEQRESNQLMEALFSRISLLKGEKGDKGDTPKKGKDYFTEEEISSMISYVLEKATPIKGVHYNDGDAGKDYVLTESDKKEIAKSVKIPAPVQEIIKQEFKIENPITTEDILKKINSTKGSIEAHTIKGVALKNDIKHIEDGMAKVDGRIKLIDQRWRGGGLSKVSHDSTLEGSGTPSDPLKVTNTGFTRLQATGAVNGQNRVYTFPSKPTWIISDGAWLEEKDYNNIANWTWVAGTLTATLTSAPQSAIWGFK